jgi:hypothetical protein
MMIHAQAEIAVAVAGDVVAEKAVLILLMHKMRIQLHKKMKILKNQLHIAVAVAVVLQEMVLLPVKLLKKMA